MAKSTKAKAPKPAKREATLDEAEEKMYLAAIHYLLHNHGMFLVPTALREVTVRGLPVWIFTVTLRYSTGHEGYVGDLLFDGEQYTFLTEKAVMDQRVKAIANDPERLRKWDEHRAATLVPGKR